MPYATTSDGCRLYYEIKGKADGQALFVNYPWADAFAEFGVGGADHQRNINRAFIERLGEHFKIVLFDYPRGVGKSDRNSEDLTAETVASDYLVVADAAGVDRFVALGYSWSANAVLQVAIRTDRCAGVAIGGWPPLSGPYEELLEFMVKWNDGLSARFLKVITRNSIVRRLIPSKKLMVFRNLTNMLDSITNYYKSLVGKWDEEKEIAKLTGPRITYFGSDDIGEPDMKLVIPLAENNRKRRSDLERLGWRVVELPGYDHTSLAKAPSGIDDIGTLLLNELKAYQW
ncbi:alpha/beta fold hydrolase [Pseudomaricurvus alkylphenolicus]|uniref:alpha/beta fold hydrolase n=1 Tax=Pseudomaricurvus alkylphenolicus TaxID=1306991 RepID=UPI00141DF1FD|nr:alpha/beta fold hydrolase [Pseudomaricurvus alkylphenolicus]NIB38145.1 alpha/beta fold hydrolase [Pseudomaricurvus alkylphenolicus]